MPPSSNLERTRLGLARQKRTAPGCRGGGEDFGGHGKVREGKPRKDEHDAFRRIAAAGGSAADERGQIAVEGSAEGEPRSGRRILRLDSVVRRDDVERPQGFAAPGAPEVDRRDEGSGA